MQGRKVTRVLHDLYQSHKSALLDITMIKSSDTNLRTTNLVLGAHINGRPVSAQSPLEDIMYLQSISPTDCKLFP